MKNKQKNKAAKKDAKATGAGRSLRQVGKGIAKLSTTKKAVGVLALATLGLGYLATRRNKPQSIIPSLANDQGAE